MHLIKFKSVRSALALLSLILGLWIAADQISTARAEDWKSTPRPHDLGVGALIGSSIGYGFPLVFTVSRPISDGFVPDIDETPSIELQIGPVFGVATLIHYSVALRWDFHKDRTWSFYGLGGLGGTLGPSFGLYPRTALGAHYWVLHNLAIRGEFSHELLGVGVLFTI